MLLTLVSAIVRPFERERVLERVARGLERNAVFGEVRSSLGVIPFKFVIVHNIRLSRTEVKCQAARHLHVIFAQKKPLIRQMPGFCAEFLIYERAGFELLRGFLELAGVRRGPWLSMAARRM